MLRTAPPSFKTEEAYRLCLSASISQSKRMLLSGYEREIVSAAESFEEACRKVKLHELDRADFTPKPGNEEDVDDLIDMYKRRMGPEYPGRPVYDEIRNIRAKCPLCGVGSVRQVDHHLPKSKFPYLAVAPMNLVPICSDCNYAKGEIYPHTYSRQTLHPYFDDIDDERWLFANLVTFSESGEPYTAEPDDSPPDWRVEFFVIPPAGWDDGLSKRVEYHFRTFNLADLYEDQTADELTGIEVSMAEAYHAGGPADVQELLRSMTRSRRKIANNTWMVALYEGLAMNIWYCNGGFHKIGEG
ncbi:hypothetical protein AB0H45_06110 [Streptomyces atroolivaceus]|uniref:hypothetical protein n=1 Tax=Streptomyces atroolivaceus TaxID=66869 RepID=UPI0033E434AA